MRVRFCGVRGSTPAPGPEFVRYGGHTSCVAVSDGDGRPRLVLDAGTGLTGVTPLLDEQPYDGSILLGHLHSGGDATVAYLSDHGPTAYGPGPDGLGERHEAALALADGADLLIPDSQHLAAQFPGVDFLGHASVEYAVALARESGVAAYALFHHGPRRTDDEIDEILEHTLRLAGSDLTVVAAREGLVVDLPAAR